MGRMEAVSDDEDQYMNQETYRTHNIVPKQRSVDFEREVYKNSRERVMQNSRSDPSQETSGLEDRQSRPRNRLEARLEELQRDVANLTQRLRSTSITNTSCNSALNLSNAASTLTSADTPQLGVSSHSLPRRSIASQLDENVPTRELKDYRRRRTATQSKSPLRKPIQSLGVAEKRKEKNMNRESTAGSKRSIRELQAITVERDQLQFELEKTKKRLRTVEKKLSQAGKWKEAYEKLKTHCVSLQESLDLSEKIRVRQKKLINQFQHNNSHKELRNSHIKTVNRSSNATRKGLEKNTDRSPENSKHSRSRAPPERIDILDSVLQMSPVSHKNDADSISQRLDALHETSLRLRARSSISRNIQDDHGGAKRSSSRGVGHETAMSFDRILQQPPTQLRMDRSHLAPRTPSSNLKRRKSVTSMTSNMAKSKSTSHNRSHFLTPTQASLAQMLPTPKRMVDRSKRPFR